MRTEYPPTFNIVGPKRCISHYYPVFFVCFVGDVFECTCDKNNSVISRCQRYYFIIDPSLWVNSNEMALDLGIIFLTLIIGLLVAVLVWSLNQKSAQSNTKG